jgi:transcriptional regulator with XRE-family HTH domain
LPPQLPSLHGLILTHLRESRGWSKRRLARALGISATLLTRLEKGPSLTREHLEVLIAPLGYPPEAIDVLLFAHGLISPEPEAEDPSSFALTAAERGRIHLAAMAGGWTAAEVLRTELSHRKRKEKVAAARQEAEEAWQRLKSAGRTLRHDLVTTFPEFRTVALVARVCEASVRAAADDVKVALELADLSLYIAERVPERQRAQAQSFAWGFVGNARRVATDFDGADAAFAKALEFSQAGPSSEPELLPEWRLLDLEASLRRAQHRFSEALELLDRARAASGEDPIAVGRILVAKGNVFDQFGDTEGSLATLAEAAPFVEASGDPLLVFAVRFNMTDDLTHLEKFREAAELLPGVRDMAVDQGNKLSRIRVVWLAAKVDAGQGRSEEAIAGLEQVRRDFTAEELPYEAALSSLDLAVLWLQAERTAEVRTLAMAMGWIFKAKGIALAALEALRLFCEAARKETATVEMTRRVIAEVEKAQRSAPSSGPGRGRR